MKIFDEKLVRIITDATDKEGCIREMVEMLYQNGYVDDKDEFFVSVIEREKMMSTGIGRMVAIPHARHGCVQEMKSAVFLLKKPIDFDSLDNQLVKVIFLFAVPLFMGKDFVKIIGKISNFLRLDENRNKIFHSKTQEELFSILEKISI